MAVNWNHISFSLLLGIVIGFFLATKFTCNTPDILTKYVPGQTRILYTEPDTIVQTSIVYRDRWHVRNAPANVLYDTTREEVSSPPYVATLDTVTASKDTIGLVFRHPEKMFDVEFRPRPDSVRTVTIETTTVVEVPDSKRFGIGIHAGAGAMQTLTGTLHAGGYIGIGINFNIWEM